MAEEAPWYYLDGTETRGPLDLASLVRLYREGAVGAATPVARAGWSDWRPAAEALSATAPPTQIAPPPSGPPGPAPAPAPASHQATAPFGPAAPAGVSAPPAPAPVAVELRCVAGPDAGRAFWIGPSEVQLDSRSGLSDPAIGELRATLAGARLWLHVVSGPPIEAQGRAVTTASLGHGETFRYGSSTWQIGAGEVKVTDLLAKLGERINKLASVDKLEGFSLREMFSEVFAKRTDEEIDEYFLVGTAKTTPPIAEVQTGWPKPWLFGRILLFLGLVYFGFFAAVQQFGNPRLVPGLILMGSIAVPFATLILFYELNSPRNVSFRTVLSLFFVGGVVSLFVSLIGFRVADFSWLGASSAGIVEEVGKLLTVVLVARSARHRYILNGLLFGAAVGAGFAAFESAGYAFWDALMTEGSLDATVRLISIRAFLTPFGHVAWTAIAAGALWRAKGTRPLTLSVFGEIGFLKAFSIPVALHMIWNSPLPSPFWSKHLVLGAIGWFVLFGLVQQGLRQVRDEQREATQRQLDSTQSSLHLAG